MATFFFGKNWGRGPRTFPLRGNICLGLIMYTNLQLLQEKIQYKYIDSIDVVVIIFNYENIQFLYAKLGLDVCLIVNCNLEMIFDDLTIYN